MIVGKDEETREEEEEELFLDCRMIQRQNVEGGVRTVPSEVVR